MFDTLIEIWNFLTGSGSRYRPREAGRILKEIAEAEARKEKEARDRITKREGWDRRDSQSPGAAGEEVPNA
ncbi:MAG: hypothetical protein HY290_19980 [Planctomycetia bacterium]|nr:hypothetical protein [Planctomycetia bacterium]